MISWDGCHIVIGVILASFVGWMYHRSRGLQEVQCAAWLMRIPMLHLNQSASPFFSIALLTNENILLACTFYGEVVYYQISTSISILVQGAKIANDVCEPFL